MTNSIAGTYVDAEKRGKMKKKTTKTGGMRSEKNLGGRGKLRQILQSEEKMSVD